MALQVVKPIVKWAGGKSQLIEDIKTEVGKIFSSDDYEQSKNEIIKNLIEQVTGSVRWRESVIFMKENGITDVVELGHGVKTVGIDQHDRDACFEGRAA